MGMVYLWATLLLLFNLLAWGSTLFTAPGNWLILFFSVVYAIVLPAEMHPQVTWPMLVIALGLALLGEAWEFLAGAAGAAKRGGSRRGAIFAIICSMIGSVMGAIVGGPVPVIGPMLGALLGGALGAFAGAYVGERNRSHTERVHIGKGALIGRLFGTAGKLICGLIMVILITIDSFSDF